MGAARLGVSKFLVFPLALALLALAMSAPLVAANNGGNSASAKICQKGGWTGWATSDGTTFASQDDCVAYGAQGGSYDALLFINGEAEPNDAFVYITVPVGTLSDLIPSAISGSYECGPPVSAANTLPCQGAVALGTMVSIAFISAGTYFGGPQPIVTCPDGTQVDATDHSGSYWEAGCPSYMMEGPAR